MLVLWWGIWGRVHRWMLGAASQLEGALAVHLAEGKVARVSRHQRSLDNAQLDLITIGSHTYAVSPPG